MMMILRLLAKRRNRIIIPKGDTLIKQKDILIIFTKTDSVDKIKGLFKVV